MLCIKSFKAKYRRMFPEKTDIFKRNVSIYSTASAACGIFVMKFYSHTNNFRTVFPVFINIGLVIKCLNFRSGNNVIIFNINISVFNIVNLRIINIVAIKNRTAYMYDITFFKEY